ncbi:MAG: ABC transporter permease [Alphaproteobacteria bacterium]|nr:ABC transporter permease [Alphaproteobacteria bacterium]TAD88298.1 MAG: ABC transporter permease [Alphaproteobacteria bacterium]
MSWRSLSRTRRIELAMPWLVTIGMLVVWEVGVIAFKVPSFILPGPVEVWQALVRFNGPIWQHAGHTLFTTVLGFAFAVVFGVLLGVAIGSSRLVYNGLYPVLIGFNSVPKVAVVPVLVVWFGIGTVPAVITAFMISFFPIVVNVATGLATVEPELSDVLRSLGARRRDILLKVGLPRAMPYLFASLKVAITLAFVGSVISETVASNEGIGYLMIQASSRFQIPLVFAGLVVIAVLGIVMYVLFALVERRFTGWAMRGTQSATVTTGS